MKKYCLAVMRNELKVKKGEKPKINLEDLYDCEFEMLQEFDDLESAGVELSKVFSTITEYGGNIGKIYVQKVYLLIERYTIEGREIYADVWYYALCPYEVYFELKDDNYYTEEEVIKRIEWYVGSGFQYMDNAREIVFKKLKERLNLFEVNGKVYYTANVNYKKTQYIEEILNSVELGPDERLIFIEEGVGDRGILYAKADLKTDNAKKIFEESILPLSDELKI